ncbi:MAG: PadR family transcriptional regulator [Acidimicrobiia bacterium]
MAPPPSTTSHAILGLLALRPWSTYELAKQVQRSLGWFWPRTERKLYEEPKRLVAAGLAKSTRQMNGSRPRTVYAVTARGRKAMRQWLDQPPAPPALEFEGMVKVFFADAGDLAQLANTLRSIADAANARVVELEAKVVENASGNVAFPERLPINTIALRFQLDHERLIGEWARWALDQIAEWRSPTDPGNWDFRRTFASVATPPPASES